MIFALIALAVLVLVVYPMYMESIEGLVI